MSFCAADVSVGGCTCVADGGGWWGGGWGAQEAGCYIFCQMSSMYLKPCVKGSCVCVSVKSVYVCVCVFFCLPDQTSFRLSSILPKISVCMSMGRNTNHAQQSLVELLESTALLLLNKTQAITEHNPFQIL